MLYDIEAVVRDKHNVPGLATDMVSGSRRRIYGRVKELTKRGQQCRVRDQQGRLLSGRDIEELDR